MSTERIGFIGAGNMATSLVRGLLATGFASDRVSVADVLPERRATLAEHFGVRAFATNVEVVARADTLVIAVKPQDCGAAIRAVAPALAMHRPLLVSIVAGVRSADIERWAGYPAAVVRCMPNTPALLGCGASALHANAHVGAEERARAEALLRAVGIVEWVAEESLLDAVTALSGSGPAYFFFLMEAMESAGIALGLDAHTARRLTLHTALGAARMALESGDAPAELRRRVTSPHGTTERAVEALRDSAVSDAFGRALRAARDRAAELGEEFATD